jgi:hypothetical protein
MNKIIFKLPRIWDQRRSRQICVWKSSIATLSCELTLAAIEIGVIAISLIAISLEFRCEIVLIALSIKDGRGNISNSRIEKRFYYALPHWKRRGI